MQRLGIAGEEETQSYYFTSYFRASDSIQIRQSPVVSLVSLISESPGDSLRQVYSDVAICRDGCVQV